MLKEKSIVTGFGAKNPKLGQRVALIGWKANRQAFACVEAVGTEAELTAA